MILDRRALFVVLLLGCLVTMGASSGLPDWSGQWEIVGVTPSANGGFEESLDQVLKEMSWGPPNNAEVQAKVEKMVALERKEMEAMRQGVDPGGAVRACTFGFPALMIDSPLMFEVLSTPKETALIFSSREIRHVYTDGRPHTAKQDLWATPWGDSIGHWEGQTLVIDTIAVKSPFEHTGLEGTPILAFGGIEEEQMITYLSSEAHFIERMRMLDKDHLEDQMTVIDPNNLTGPWRLSRTYRRVTHIQRMVYEDCEGEERNPIVNGRFTLTPPPAPPTSLPPPAAKTAPPP
ncbi:MAG TPA: hypothetical protein VEJ45_04265 [Candidatus Acidoferrales bacterium]|nr:hypothetical protein [Candidatus Acidoferrales bacterium]